MNTQKAVTIVSQNRYDQVIISHRCSEPNPKSGGHLPPTELQIKTKDKSKICSAQIRVSKNGFH